MTLSSTSAEGAGAARALVKIARRAAVGIVCDTIMRGTEIRRHACLPSVGATRS